MRTFQASLLALALGASGAAMAASSSTTDAAKVGTAAEKTTRDWAQADANKDHLVSPEEMMAYLKANPGPLHPDRQSAGAAATDRTAAAKAEPANPTR